MNILMRGRIALAAFTLIALTAVVPVLVRASDDAHSDGPPREASERASANDAEAGRSGFTVRDFEAAGVGLATAGPGEVDIGVELPGEVRPDADRIAHVAPRFPGIARDVRKQLGDRVAAGDVLAVVESDNLSRFDLVAAFDGTVIGKHIAAGETVRPAEAVYIIADLSTVWVHVNIYQNALSQVRLEQPVVITASGGTLEARSTVSYISPVVDQATRTATARVVLTNPDGAWRPGLFVTATILNPVAAPVVVARDALQTLGGETVVFVQTSDRFEVRPVIVGSTGRTRVEILRGLTPGERFAEHRSFLVKAELAKDADGEDHEH